MRRNMDINNSAQPQNKSVLRLSPGAIKTFKRAYLLEYHEVISDEEADRMGTNLLMFLKLGVINRQLERERKKYV